MYEFTAERTAVITTRFMMDAAAGMPTMENRETKAAFAGGQIGPGKYRDEDEKSRRRKTGAGARTRS